MRVLVFGGTVEGRTVIEALLQRKVPVMACVATEYGAGMLTEQEDLTIRSGRMGQHKIVEVLADFRPDLLIDATHPYSQNVSDEILAALQGSPVPYLRVERELTDGENIEKFGKFFDTMREAVDYLNTTTGKILITTGSKELETYTLIRDYAQRCVLRTLPSEEVLQNCKNAGFLPENLILMQGPFSLEMNIATLHQTGCRILVTRNSGRAGGFEEKAEACRQTGCELLIIGTPKKRILPENGMKKTLEETLEYLAQCLDAEERT